MTSDSSDGGGPDETPASAQETGSPAPTASDVSELESLRAENERLRQEVEAADGDHKKGHGDPRKRRRRLSITLAVFTAILLPLSITTLWTKNLLLNTDKYVETVSPLASDPAIQSAVATGLTSQVIEALDLETFVEDLLPEEAQPLAGFIAVGGDNLVATLADKAVKSEQFETVWVEANRAAHEKLVVLLTGGSTDLVGTAGGEVTLSLEALLDTVLGGVEDFTGIDLAGLVPGGVIESEFVLFQSEELADIQTAVKWFDRIAWFLVIAFVACLLGAIFLAEDRRLGVRRGGIALVASTIVTLIGLAFVRDIYSNGTFENLEAALNAFDIVTNFLRMSLRAVLAFGVVFITGAWLFGPSAAALKVRGWGQLAVNAADETAGGRDLGPVPRFLDDHRTPITWSVVALGVAWLLLLDHPTGLTVLGIALLCGVVIGAITLVAGLATQAAEAEPADATVGASADVKDPAEA